MNRILQWIQSNFFKKIGDYGFVAGILIVMMMIIPLPTVLLDFFMILNLLLSIIIILNILNITSPLAISSFPTLLLFSTVFSLALNVSSTRLILSQGELFDGKIVRAFGTFVVGTSSIEGLVIGPIIFIIIMIVQFIVITRGASRVAEVSARFTLDSMPGKQMAIEAEFNSGAISEEELIQKRKDLQRESDFYGSMDGASKFISGNIIAGFIITFINIAGGLIVGVLVRGEQISTAAVNYIQLTIGDGLVSQLPALLISTASGVIVTKVASSGSISEEVYKDLTSDTKLYYVAGALLAFLAFLPGFPWYILLPLAAVLIFAAYLSGRNKRKVGEKQSEQASQEVASTGHVEQPKLEPLDPIALEIGYDIVPLVQDDTGTAELLNRITSIRREVGVKLGFVIPLIRIVDNYLLKPNEYSIKFSGIEYARATIFVNKLLAIQTEKVSQDTENTLMGELGKDPAFGLPAYWIAAEDKAEAERLGYMIADPNSVISTHIATVIETNASDLLSRQDVSNMLDDFKERYPAIVNDVTQHLSIGQLHRVLQRLLEEKISIRNLRSILETLSDYGVLTKDISFLVEKARQSLARQITAQYSDNNSFLYVYSLDPDIERILSDTEEGGGALMIEPQLRTKIIQAIANAFSSGSQYNGSSPVLVTSELVRPVIYKLLAMTVNSKQYVVPVLSVLEITSSSQVQTLGAISLQEKELV